MVNDSNISLSNNVNSEESYEFIKNLNLGFNDQDISDALNKTNNHLNLSIRYLLFNGQN